MSKATATTEAITRLREIMHQLRAPGGCPWDQEQTHESLIPCMIEEAYETAAAIRAGNRDEMEEELGDLLLQVVFHAELGTETGAFDFDSICDAITDKLIRRHPHVFAESDADTADEVLKQWEEIKAGEKDQTKPKPYLHEVGQGFPSLLRAREIQKKVAKVGFDWDNSEEVLAKVREELGEVEEAMEAGNAESLSEEIGDLLFAVVNLARKEKLDAESLLAAANDKFIDRFHQVEETLKTEGKSLKEATLEEMDAAWEDAKDA